MDVAQAGGGRRAAFGPDPATILTVVGMLCVVLGGLVAAVTEPLDLAHGSWTAAYLVLVSGVAQYAMGRARTLQRGSRTSPTLGWVQLGGWNVGGALVIAGTLAGEPLVVDLGSMLLVVALATALHDTRAGDSTSAADPLSPWLGRAYRAGLLVLAVSIPIGVALAHLRHS